MAGLTFLIMFLVLLLLVAVVPMLLKRFHIPAVISMLMVGMAIGPNAFDIIGKLSKIFGRGFPPEQLYGIIEAMGLLGLVFLMALAGMEVDLKIMKSEKKAISYLSIFTFLIPAIAGYFVYAYFDAPNLVGKLLYASLFASHSVGIVFPVIRELGAVQSRFGIAVLASTVITDIGSLVLLALCVQMKRHQAAPTAEFESISIFDHIEMAGYEGTFFVLFLLAIIAYIIICMRLIPLAGHWVFRRLSTNDDARMTFFLATVLLTAFLGELIGINIIVAAFIAGMALVRVELLHEDDGILHRKLEGAGYGIMIPFLFLSIGMKTNLGILFHAWENFSIVILTVCGLVGSKLFSGWLAMRLSGFDHPRSVCAGLMTIPQLSATLAAAAVAIELDMIDQRFFNAIIVLSIVTTLPVPVLVKILISKYQIKFQPVYKIPRIPDGAKLDETLI
jgi:Kef-type K+ transport system membrane component KefB